MQFERRAPAFVVLRADQPPVQRKIFRPRGFECAGERVKANHNDRQFAWIGLRQPNSVALTLKV
jgi:hypothetical protein